MAKESFEDKEIAQLLNKDFISRIQYGKSTCTIKKSVLEVPFTKTYIAAIEHINRLLLAYSFVSRLISSTLFVSYFCISI